MDRRRVIGVLQNLIIALLASSALLLVLLVVSYENGRDGRLPAWKELFPSVEGTGPAVSSNLTALSAPVNIVVTNQYGRGSCLLTGDDSAAKEQMTRLLQEALGSAGAVEAVTEDLFRAALDAPGVYFDYLIPLPAAIVASRLGAETDLGGQLRRALLSREGETVRLYLWDGAGAICRYPTAVSADVLTEAVDLFGTDDTFFAFEAGEDYEGLDPYSVLQQGKLSFPSLTAAAAPIVSDIDALLSHLDFVRNPLRYPEGNGTVVVEDQRTLRIRPDGVLLYTGDTPTAAGPLLEAAGGRENPSAIESVLSVHRLMETLLGDEGDASWYLSGYEETAEGCRLRFDYLVNGVPVYFADDVSAMEAEIAHGVIIAFSLRCRQYALNQETVSLLPVRQAAAIAADRYPEGFLTLGYADRSAAVLSPGWLVRQAGSGGFSGKEEAAWKADG